MSRPSSLLLTVCCLGAGIAHAEPSLYERIGADKLSVIVSEYVDVLAADPGTQRAFRKSDLKRVKTMLALQLCDLTGGACKYDGDSMREVHAGHGIDHREFYRGVELLRAVLVRNGVSIRERNELLRLLAPMMPDVVERRAQ